MEKVNNEVLPELLELIQAPDNLAAISKQLEDAGKVVCRNQKNNNLLFALGKLT